MNDPSFHIPMIQMRRIGASHFTVIITRRITDADVVAFYAFLDPRPLKQKEEGRQFDVIWDTEIHATPLVDIVRILSHIGSICLVMFIKRTIDLTPILKQLPHVDTIYIHNQDERCCVAYVGCKLPADNIGLWNVSAGAGMSGSYNTIYIKDTLDIDRVHRVVPYLLHLRAKRFFSESVHLTHCVECNEVVPRDDLRLWGYFDLPTQFHTLLIRWRQTLSKELVYLRP